MVAVKALAALLAIASPLLVRADVTPSEPAPGRTFNTGTTCRVTWEGDKDSTTNWKDMAIQLMTGDNLNMVHLTTVTTDQDGTKNGAFTFTCPDVAPYSAIYFYQFSSPHIPDHTWTTRFTIASASGDSVPPANTKQPDGSDVPWGVGELVDPSTAVDPPAWVSGSSGNTTSTRSASATSSRAATSTSSRMITSSSASSKLDAVNATGSSSSAGAATTGAALGSSIVDARIWFGTVSAFVAAALL